MESLFQDIKYGFRMLYKHAGFTGIAAFTLALGIAGSITIFSIVDAVLLRPLPYPNAGRLVAVYETSKTGDLMPISRLDLEDLQRQSKSLETLEAYGTGQWDLIGGSEPERVLGAAVTPGFFSVFGVQPILGRTFKPGDPSEFNTIVIGEGLWRSRFGGQPSALGQTVKVLGGTHTIIGVLPSNFDFPSAARMWIPLDLSQDDSERSAHNYRVVANLKPGANLAGAQTEISSIAARLEKDYPKSNKGVGAKLVSLRDVLSGNVRDSLILLLVLVGFLLLIASANVAGLLVVRMTSRYTEIAARTALGASRSRLVRQLLTESLLLSLPSGLLGLVFSTLLNGIVKRFTPGYLLPSQQPGLDALIFVFIVGISITASFLAGLIPSWRLTKVEGVPGLQRTSAHDPWLQRLRKGLVALQVSLSLMLLIGAGLTTKSFYKLENERIGVNPQHLLVVEANAGASSKEPEKIVRFYTDVIERLRALPGVVAASGVNGVPLSGRAPNGGVLIDGRPSKDERDWPSAGWHLVDYGYFQTMEIPILRGRGFLPEGEESIRAAIVNETIVKRYWPDENPIGKRIALPGLDKTTYQHFREGNNDWFTVVGVAGDVREDGLGITPGPEVYLPFYQHPYATRFLSLVLRTSLPQGTLEPSIKHEIRSLNSDSPVRMREYTELTQQTVRAPRFRSFLTCCFAVLAVLLAMVGIYGLVSQSVNQRRHEIGIRLALGAQQGDVVRLMLLQGFRLVAIGLLLGLAFAFTMSRLMNRFLYGVNHNDIIIFAAATLFIGITAVLASYFPARHATQIDPSVVLRSE